MTVNDNREAVRAARRTAFDRGDPALLAEATAAMDTEVERQRDQADRVIADAAKTPGADWEQIAATVSDEVWERILNDMPVSRPLLEAIRPSKLHPTQAEIPAA